MDSVVARKGKHRHTHNTHHHHRRGPWVPPAFVASYIEAFNKHYPAKHIEVKPRKADLLGQQRFAVLIDGDAGDITLTESDMRSATRMFQR